MEAASAIGVSHRARRIRRSYAWPAPATGPYGSQVAMGVMTPLFTIISVGAFWFMLFATLSLAQTAYHYSPELREWLRHLPDAWHNIAASFRS